MKRTLRTIVCLALAALFITPVFAVDELPPVVIIPEEIPRNGNDGQFPFNGQILTTNWSATASEPTDWIALSVLNLLDLENLPLPVEYPSKWKYEAALNATAIVDKGVAAHVLMLPFINIPAGKNNLVLSVDAMVNGAPADGDIPGSMPLVYCATEGKDVRFDGNVFFEAMMGAVMNPEMSQPVLSTGEFENKTFEIKDKGGKGLNIVLVYINLNPALVSDVTFAIRNAKLYDPDDPMATDLVAKNNINVYAVDGSVVVENAPEGASLSLVNLQSGILYAAKTVASAVETVAVPYPGVYAVVINGESFKINVR